MVSLSRKQKLPTRRRELHALLVEEPDHGIVAAPDGAPKRIPPVREVVQSNLAVGISLPLQQSFLK